MENQERKHLFDVITDFLATNPTPQEIIAYRLPDHLQERAHELLDLNGEGKLNFDQQQEMFDFVRVDEMMSLLKAKMKLRLQKQINPNLQ